MCMVLFKSLKVSLCIFVDGLDEVAQKATGVLICKQSTRSTTFWGAEEKSASQADQNLALKSIKIFLELPLHKLTQAYIKLYTHHQLPNVGAYGGINRDEIIRDVTKILVWNSQGVSIWLALAIKSVVVDSRMEIRMRRSLNGSTSSPSTSTPSTKTCGIG